MAGLAFAWFGTMPIVLYLAYRQEGFDLGIYDQIIWLLAHGLDTRTVGPSHVFGGHFSPILYVLTPLAGVAGGAIPELVTESALLASTVFPLHVITRRLGTTSVPILAAFVFHPGVFTASWYGFHPWTLATPVLVWSVVALMERPRWWVLTSFGLAGITIREDIGFWVVVFAAILAVAGRLTWRAWFIGAVLPGLASLAVVAVVIPELTSFGGYLFAASYLGETTTVGLFEYTGATSARIAYLVVPLGLLLSGLRSVRWRLALPLLVPLLGLGLQDGNALATAFHYDLHLAVGMIVVLAFSTVYLPTARSIILSSLGTAAVLGALRPTSPDIGPNPWGLLDKNQELAEVHAQLDEMTMLDTSLSLPTELVPHFSERREIFIYPAPFELRRERATPFVCPPPEILVVDGAVHPTINQDGYRAVWTGDRYTIYRLEGDRPTSPCGFVG